LRSEKGRERGSKKCGCITVKCNIKRRDEKEGPTDELSDRHKENDNMT
jgi:hypothetical protein